MKDARLVHYEAAMVNLHVPGVKVVSGIASGYRQMGSILAVTEKAIRFDYYGWSIWIPKKCVRQVRNKREFWAQAWAVESAKNREVSKS